MTWCNEFKKVLTPRASKHRKIRSLVNQKEIREARVNLSSLQQFRTVTQPFLTEVETDAEVSKWAHLKWTSQILSPLPWCPLHSLNFTWSLVSMTSERSQGSERVCDPSRRSVSLNSTWSLVSLTEERSRGMERRDRGRCFEISRGCRAREKPID